MLTVRIVPKSVYQPGLSGSLFKDHFHSPFSKRLVCFLRELGVEIVHIFQSERSGRVT